MALSIPDLIITIAYFSIPLQIVISLCLYPRLTQRGMKVSKIVILLVLFAFFIFLCGAGHLMRCLNADTNSTLFRTINILTAIVSLVTALYLIPLTPSLLGSLDESLLHLDRSTKIVDSLFPEPVRERLMKSLSFKVEPTQKNLRRDSELLLPSSDDSKDGEAKVGTSTRSKLPRRFSDQFSAETISRMTEFLRGRRQSSCPDFNVRDNMLDSHGAMASAPIAECFPDSSILFADLAGFTSWSSAHEPTDVFTLLENLFWEFDEIATELGVFKVCTIGDCYLAATGLHDPRPDHAVVLAEFAERCRRKTNEITESLVETLGADTADLSMRFGLHSGPVTAGVLRGQKSRFELFGDTINTASRMESTGVSNRIQVSQETADLIFEGGKGEWVAAREGLVDAKGKGKLQTYWLEVDLPEDEEGGSSEDANSDLSGPGRPRTSTHRLSSEHVEEAAPSRQKAITGEGNSTAESFCDSIV